LGEVGFALAVVDRGVAVVVHAVNVAGGAKPLTSPTWFSLRRTRFGTRGGNPDWSRLRAHHIEGVVATELPDLKRHIYAATYGEPPATAALLAALADAATSAVTSSAQNLGPIGRLWSAGVPTP
jgi:hypothetical protein